MADQMEFHADAEKVVVWVSSPQLIDELGGGVRRWTTDQVVTMAEGKEWGYGLDTQTAAKAIRNMDYRNRRLAIEFDPDGVELVVARHIASGAVGFVQEMPTANTIKVVLAMIWSAARRGVGAMFDPLPVPWWAGLSPGATPPPLTVGNYSTHHLNAKVPVFAHKPKKDGALFDPGDQFLAMVDKGARGMMKEDPDRLKKRVTEERMELVRILLTDNWPKWVSSYWKLSDDEAALDAFLSDQFAAYGTPSQWPDEVQFDTIADLMAGMGWPDNSTNRDRIRRAMVNLHAISRPHVYRYKLPNPKKKKGKGGFTWFRSLEPLWRVQYEVGGGGGVIVRPGDPKALRHQIDPSTGGAPHYYTQLPIGRFAELEGVGASTMVAREADDLLTAFMRDAARVAPEPDNPAEFILAYTLGRWAQQWTPMKEAPMARIRTKEVKDEAETEARAKVNAFVKQCIDEGRKLTDKELAAHLGVVVKEATRLRERAGIALRAQHKSVVVTPPMKPNKVKEKVERALEVLATRWPGFIVEVNGRLMDARPRENEFRVRIRPVAVVDNFAHPSHRVSIEGNK
jgi:hypothetical protein